MAIKSKELASMLGVSTATVSLVLNHKPGISDELRKTLLERIREMGYGYMIKEDSEREEDHSSFAKAIAYVVLSEYRDDLDEASFFPTVIEGAEREARYLGYHFSIVHMYGENRDLKETITRSQYAGMIVYADVIEERLKRELDATQVPYILIDCFEPSIEASAVTVNNRQGVYTAVRYLYEKGHRRIGYVGSGRRHCSLGERRQCFRYALEDLGMREEPGMYIETGCTGQRAQEYLERLWKGDVHPPSALLVENDVLAIPVYRALKNSGYRIPEDVSVIGFDGRSVCSMLEPTLTTMRIPRRMLGRTLVTLLADKINRKERSMEDVTMRVEINAELVEMESVCPAEKG